MAYKNTVQGPLRENLRGLALVTPQADTFYVDTNDGSDSQNGKSWQSAYVTMQEAFDHATPGCVIAFRGNIREQLTTPAGVPDVTIIGAGTRPRHADTHPLNGEVSGSTWKLPADGGTNVPLLIIRNPGWRFLNICFVAHASNYAVRMERNAVEDATEQDASHAEFLGCRFASGAGGISDTGGCADVRVEDCYFQGLTTACILSVGNIGVGASDWVIRGNRFIGFTNGVKIPGFGCVITGNYFTDGGTPNTTFVLWTVSVGGDNNFVVGNFFQTTSANFNTPDIIGAATDVWAMNVSIDSTAAGVGGNFEWGQPAA